MSVMRSVTHLAVNQLTQSKGNLYRHCLSSSFSNVYSLPTFAASRKAVALHWNLPWFLENCLLPSSGKRRDVSSWWRSVGLVWQHEYRHNLEAVQKPIPMAVTHPRTNCFPMEHQPALVWMGWFLRSKNRIPRNTPCMWLNSVLSLKWTKSEALRIHEIFHLVQLSPKRVPWIPFPCYIPCHGKGGVAQMAFSFPFVHAQQVSEEVSKTKAF